MTRSTLTEPVSLGSPLRAEIVLARVMAVITAVFAVSIVLMRLLVPWPEGMLHGALLGSEWLIWLPLAAASAFLWAAAYPGHLEFSSAGVACVSLVFRRSLRWDEVCLLHAPRKANDEKSTPFPAQVRVVSSRYAVIFPDADVRKSIAFQPARLDSLTSLQSALEQLIEGSPAAAIDCEVVLMLGLARRLSALADADSMPMVQVRSLDPADPVVAEVLQHPVGQEAVAAPFEYFAGSVTKALALCDDGLRREPGSWDLLLCRALSQEKLGSGEWTGSLAGSLDAVPDDVVGRVLGYASKVGSLRPEGEDVARRQLWRTVLPWVALLVLAVFQIYRGIR